VIRQFLVIQKQPYFYSCAQMRGFKKKKTILYPTNTSGILVRAAKPVSVIWRLSRLRFFSELKPEIFFKPMSVINVKERLMLCKLRRPAETEQLNICF